MKRINIISFDKLMMQIAYFYIFFPFILFCIGWLRWYYALTAIFIITASVILSLKDTNEYINVNILKNKNKIFVTLTVILIWVLFSGIGSYAYQTEDHNVRNALLNDLTSHKWPYKLNEGGHIFKNAPSVIFVYYISYWLPAAFVGKLFGVSASYFTLFLWTYIGMTLTIYFFFRYFKRFKLYLLLIFMLFSNLYVIGSFLKFGFNSLMTSDWLPWTDYYFSGSTTYSLYWVYNQCVVPWLICMVILNNVTKKNILFLYSICYIHGPFFFIGFFPFFLTIILKDINWEIRIQKNNFLQAIKKYTSFQNVFGGIIAISIAFLYFQSGASTQGLRIQHIFVSGSIFKHTWTFNTTDFLYYILFLLSTFGIISFFMYKKYKKEPFYYIIILSFVILPFILLGNLAPFTFYIRVSLATQFMLLILVSKYLIEEKINVYKNLVVSYVILSSLDGFLTIGRSLVFTTLYHTDHEKMNRFLFDHTYFPERAIYDPDNNYLLQNDMRSYDSPKAPFILNTLGKGNNTFFVKYLLK